MTNSKPSGSAERMTRLRNRRKRGAIMVSIELTAAGIDRMVEKGWLRPEKRGNKQALGQALLDLGAAALWPG